MIPQVKKKEREREQMPAVLEHSQSGRESSA